VLRFLNFDKERDPGQIISGSVARLVDDNKRALNQIFAVIAHTRFY
jgi:hypothetical protein